MVQLGLTPWRDVSELLVVRERFYPSGLAGNEDRRQTAELRRAVDLVRKIYLFILKSCSNACIRSMFGS